jgi:2-hydroxychromene-2-carboxylate isomerase
MPLASRLRAHLLGIYLGDGLRNFRRWFSRWVRLTPRRLTFFHQPDDPYSHLLLQVLPRLRPILPLTVRIVPPPDPVFTPEPERLREWALRDATMLAERHGLSLPAEASVPSLELMAVAQGLAVAAGDDLDALARIGDALLRGAAGELTGAAAPDTAEHLATSRAMRMRMGHYLGGMLHFGGEWYWGIDRLDLLLERLAAEGHPVDGVLPEPVALQPVSVPADTPLEFFFSFRSPYSYLAIKRTLDLAERLGVRLIIRPVLPMVMRGLSVPGIKARTLAKDAACLARQQGQPFGRICDPLGAGIRSCLGLFAHARTVGGEAALLLSAGRGIWAEGLDMTDEGDLRTVATRAGLDWAAARPWLTRPDGEALAEANRQALLETGLWGVPSFRYGPLVIWGQDRLDVLEQLIGDQRSP